MLLHDREGRRGGKEMKRLLQTVAVATATMALLALALVPSASADSA